MIHRTEYDSNEFDHFLSKTNITDDELFTIHIKNLQFVSWTEFLIDKIVINYHVFYNHSFLHRSKKMVDWRANRHRFTFYHIQLTIAWNHQHALFCVPVWFQLWWCNAVGSFIMSSTVSFDQSLESIIIRCNEWKPSLWF